MDELRQDIRYGVRQLAASKTVSAAAVLCIAIGVGANTTIFSVVNAVLLRPVAGIAEGDGLLEMGRAQAGEAPLDTLSYPVWRDVIEATRDELEIGLWNFSPLAVSGDTEPEVVLGFTVTPAYFSVLGVEPALGRFFTQPEASVEAAESLAVLSHGLWQRRYGGDPEILGRTIRVNGEPATVVGIGPPGFGGHLSVLKGDLWVPLGMRASGMPGPDDLGGRFNQFLLGVGRLRPGVSLDAAQAAGSAAMASVVREFPRLEGMDVGMVPLGALPSFVQLVVGLFLAALMVVVGLVLMIACLNVAGMLLSRGVARRREIAVRMALGAGRARVVRQLLTESLLLFALGGGIGVLISVWLTGLLVAFNPPTPPPFEFTLDLGLDQRVLGFSLLLALSTGVVFSLGPALSATGAGLLPALKDAGGGGSRRSRLGAGLVTGQVAFTVLLLVASGLFLRSLISARTIDPGFNPDGVVTMGFDLSLHGYDADAGRRFYAELRDGLDRIPGVDASSAAALLPLGLPSNISFGGVNVVGVDPPAEQSSWDGNLNIVTPGYFETLEIPLLAGRDFDAADVEGAPRVAIINESMARHFWPTGAAVGESFITGSFSGGTSWQVVGVVRDSKYSNLTANAPFFTYMPLEQAYWPQMSVQIRGRGAAPPPLAAIRGVVDRLDPGLPFMEVIGLREYVEIAFLPQRIAGTLAGALGMVGLLLGAVGIYGVTAHAVSRRIPEMGIRKALGAPPAELLRLVVRQGMAAPLVGVAIGLIAAFVATRFLEAFLVGISPLDPTTFGAVLAVICGVALLANYVPARRAAAVEPIIALRRE